MYKPVVGLEIHVELKTKSKMFCDCKNDAVEKNSNVNICPTCTAQPGTLPVINKEAVDMVIKTGLALGCKIPDYSKFDRKNYFYPDLPKGYQISQYDKPLCEGGHLFIGGKKINITRVHLEEDTGKLIHPSGAEYSLIDFNRAGVPLMELVTEPELGSAKEARAFAQELQLLLRYIGVSDADMEKGQMRVEANISLSQKEGVLGTKVEIKNLNSFRVVERGIDYEIQRQEKVLEDGQKVIQETRGWDDSKEITFSQREKEEAHDYRYFPEPDLPKLNISQEKKDLIEKSLPELPWQKRERFAKEYGLDEKSIEMFVFNKELGGYFEKAVLGLGSYFSSEELPRLIKLTANYIISDLQGLLKESSSKAISEIMIKPEDFSQFIILIGKGTISSKIAKIVILEMFKTGKEPSLVIQEGQLSQITDESEIEKTIKEIIMQNPKALDDFKKGQENAFQFLVGQIMSKTKGKANPQLVREILEKELKEI